MASVELRYQGVVRAKAVSRIEVSDEHDRLVPGVLQSAAGDWYFPGLMRPDSPAIQLGLKAFERVLGVKPLLLRSGGTLPIVPALADRGIATVITGFALPESNVHSPNEKFLVRYFEQGVDTAAAMYTEYRDLPVS